jgi:hypothetical protein
VIGEILHAYALNPGDLSRLVADLGERQMVAQAAGMRNHPAWTIGHLIDSAKAIGGELGLAPWLPDDWGRRFGTGSIPVPVVSVYPGKTALLNLLDDGQVRLADALNRLGEVRLAEALPGVRYRDRLPTLGHAVLRILASHTALHVGQVVVWRRAGVRAVARTARLRPGQTAAESGVPGVVIVARGR